MTVKVKVTGSGEPTEVEVKRFYLPGFVIEANCPKCKQLVTRDLGCDYLSFPKANEPFEDTLFCDCDEEFPIKLFLRITLEPAPQNSSRKPT